MKQQKVNWQKIAIYFLFYAGGIASIDWILGDSIDFRRVIAIPIIAIGLLYLVNKNRFMIEE